MSKLNNPNFHFEYTSLAQTLKKLEKADPKKSSEVNVALFINHDFINSLSCSTFPTTLTH